MRTMAKGGPMVAPILDDATWQDLWAMGDMRAPGFLVESVRLFEERTHACERELDSAFDATDRSRLARVAHALAGSAASIGASRLYDLAARLEAECDQPWDEVAHLVVRVHVACVEARDALWVEIGV